MATIEDITKELENKNIEKEIVTEFVDNESDRLPSFCNRLQIECGEYEILENFELFQDSCEFDLDMFLSGFGIISEEYILDSEDEYEFMDEGEATEYAIEYVYNFVVENDKEDIEKYFNYAF